jgi:pimeloyl-ACP methyl ester carboxylesterase
MSGTLYALLVGINDYAPNIGRLEGCVNDVDHVHSFLKEQWDPSSLAVQVLKNSDATRNNIINQFRTHLSRAASDDVALFHYCGHGARWQSAPEFHEFYPEGFDEGLVCYDSRSVNAGFPFDLADKELAVLLAEVAAHDPHLAVILDCCHSGSGTRDADGFARLKVRQTYPVSTERPLETYLDGYYTALQRQGAPLSIPRSNHILLAACDRKQKAYEAPDRSGLFTSTLLKVLRASRGEITYADLFVRCRAAIRDVAENQTPQFETSGDFNAFRGFLGSNTTSAPRRYSVYCKDGSWTIDAGALHGFPTEPDRGVGLALYGEVDSTRLAGHALTSEVGPQKSVLTLDFAARPEERYAAEITSLPVPPFPIRITGDEEGTRALRSALLPRHGIELTDGAAGTSYGISAANGVFLLQQSELSLEVQHVKGYSEASAGLMLSIAKQVVQWHRGLALQNARTRIDPSRIDFEYADAEDGREYVYPEGEVILDFTGSGSTWNKIRGKFRARNRTDRALFFVLVYFSPSYGIHILRNDPIPPGDAFVTLWGEDPADYFYLEEDQNESLERFTLIVSTEPVDDFLLAQEDLEPGTIASSKRAIGSVKPAKKFAASNDWCTKLIRVKVVRRMDQVGSHEVVLAKGRIVIQPHRSLTANASLAAAVAPTRSPGESSDFYKALERNGLTLLNFAGSRGVSESILELTDIQDAGALANDPLEIELRVPCNADEGILPFVFDGQHLLLGGDVSKDDGGNTHIRIDHIPDIPDQRRSLGGSLKLYFFKTYLKHSNVNQLRWVEFKTDNTCAYHKSAVADKVTSAKNILLLVHGIIGDTEGMAQGLQESGLSGSFDLVLAYDYENLSTPIQRTAQELKSQLGAAGLGDNDGKKLTLLVHSMGGLVSRWFIEREGGNTMVDHLVMCGTPNNGSPFGQVDGARKVLNVLTAVAVNYVPMVLPFSSAVLLLLNRSKKITPTLEQMNPSAEFIKTLNASADPRVRYTLLAGDVDEYNEPGDPFLARMLAKAGRSVLFEALFGMKANDIAVSVESILGVEANRAIPPTRKNVACHHLNYFVSRAGQHALSAVEW